MSAGDVLIIPVGSFFQEMTILAKTPAGVVERRTIPVRFVPLVRTPGG